MKININQKYLLFVLSGVLLVAIIFSVVQIVKAVTYGSTPAVGHAWSGIQDFDCVTGYLQKNASGVLTCGSVSEGGGIASCMWYSAQCNSDGTKTMGGLPTLNCDLTNDTAGGYCPSPKKIIAGGCQGSTGSNLTISRLSYGTQGGWYCDWTGDAGTMFIQILCCEGTIGGL